MRRFSFQFEARRIAGLTDKKAFMRTPPPKKSRKRKSAHLKGTEVTMNQEYCADCKHPKSDHAHGVCNGLDRSTLESGGNPVMSVSKDHLCKCTKFVPKQN